MAVSMTGPTGAGRGTGRARAVVGALAARPVALAAVLAAVVAGVAPLGDPDLPEHLAVGEWIVRHGALPLVEPFAWTRPGQPYFAYSWLAQVTYYGVLALAGPLGLHVLQALTGVAAVVAAAVFARGRGWSAPVAAALGALNFAAMGVIANELRPEQLLFVLVPLAWALADAAGRDGPAGDEPVNAAVSGARAGPAAAARAAPGGGRGRRRNLLGHLGVGCAAANVHLFFALTAAPLILRAAVAGARERRRYLLPAAALVAGWLLSPNALHWPALFRLNFAPNVLLGRPPVIGEMAPGFEAMLEVAGALVLVPLLLALPWLRAGRPASARARLVEALAWAGGLALFAFAYRLLAIWWLVCLPAVGGLVAAAAAALEQRPRLRAGSIAALGALVLVTGMPPWPSQLRLEGGIRSRTLPTDAAAAARPLADWLVCRTDPTAGGRIFTSFHYGSYLTWRLPRYSVSIDGRTIFPDSVAREFAYGLRGDRGAHALTWAHAELAVIPRWMAVNDALAASPAWVRLAGTGGRSAHGATLWARAAWWRRWRAAPRSPSCMHIEGISGQRREHGGGQRWTR